MVGFDFDDLEPVLVKENELLLLGINGGSVYIPLRVMARVEVPYIYDPIAEGQLAGPLAASPSLNGVTANTYQTALQFGSNNISGRPSDVFDLTRYPNYVYQMFLGVAPSLLRVFLQQPWHTDERSLPIISYTPNYSQSGWWDGLMSPFYRPSRKTQMWVLPGASIALGYENIEPQVVNPLFLFYINALGIAVVTDPATAYAMVSQKGMAKIFTVAGLQPISYNVPSHYGIEGVHLDDTLAEVTKGVTPTQSSPVGLVTRQQ